MPLPHDANNWASSKLTKQARAALSPTKQGYGNATGAELAHFRILPGASFATIVPLASFQILLARDMDAISAQLQHRRICGPGNGRAQIAGTIMTTISVEPSIIRTKKGKLPAKCVQTPTRPAGKIATRAPEKFDPDQISIVVSSAQKKRKTHNSSIMAISAQFV